MRCLICDKDVKKLNALHLRKHGISLDEYREKYMSGYTEEKEEEKIEELDDLLFDGFNDEIFNYSNKTIEDEVNESDPNKKRIILHLKRKGFDIKNNHIILINDEFRTLEIVTDIADPRLKIDFEFPNAFWHNNQPLISKSVRERVLEEKGWTIYYINEKNPQPEHIDELLSKLR